jgi:NAD(P)-dependent dehydrogenase (short-subunit alcohol dehydrogenase family)
MTGKPKVALVTGACSGIGLALVDQLLSDWETDRVYACCRNPDSSPELYDRMEADSRLVPVSLDVTSERSIAAAMEIIGRAPRLDLVINTAGLLHNENGMRPEKRLSEVNADDLLLAFDVNALGTMRLAMALEPLLKESPAPRFLSLSARVGSIEDNRAGGWYAYRASKAALNMLLKTLAIEWSRLRPRIVCAALHPGTVATSLSAPFTRNRKSTQQLFTPSEAAGHLLGVIAGLQPEQSGGFFAWDGTEIPW